MAEMDRRIVYLDTLRVLATLGVVVLHTSAKGLYVFPLASAGFWVNHLVNSLVRWAVPVFVMISGALLLDRELRVPEILRKCVLRLAVPFFFWGILYAMDEVGKANTLAVILRGDFHLWYLLMLGGLYLCQPFLYQIAAKKHLTQWFLLLGFLFSFLLPQVLQLCRIVPDTALDTVAAGVSSGMKKMAVQTVQGYAVYFLLGWWLSRRRCSDRWALGLMLAGTLLTVALVPLHTAQTGQFEGQFYDYFTVNVFLASVGVFILVKNHEISGAFWKKIVSWLSKYSFGVYLSHVLVMERLEALGLSAETVPGVLWTVGMSAVFIVLAYALSWVLNHIAVLRRVVR